MVISILANSADPDEMQHNAAFIWVSTVYQNTGSGVSRTQRVNNTDFKCDTNFIE